MQKKVTKEKIKFPAQLPAQAIPTRVPETVLYEPLRG